MHSLCLLIASVSSDNIPPLSSRSLNHVQSCRSSFYQSLHTETQLFKKCRCTLFEVGVPPEKVSFTVQLFQRLNSCTHHVSHQRSKWSPKPILLLNLSNSSPEPIGTWPGVYFVQLMQRYSPPSCIRRSHCLPAATVIECSALAGTCP